MANYNEMSNNQIQNEIQLMKAEYDAIKVRMLNDYDRLEEIQHEYLKANQVFLDRVKGQKNEQ